MPRKKQKIYKRNDDIQHLKKQWLELASKEKIGKKSSISNKLDKLELEIEKLKNEGYVEND